MNSLKEIATSLAVGFLLGSAIVSTEADAQSRTIVVDAPEVSAAVTGMRVAFLSDAGCTIQAEVSRSAPVVDLLRAQPQPRNARAAVCNAALNAAQAAARLDFQVSDGGAP